MSVEILCTLGPASLNGKVIHRLEEAGVSLFRINLSHTELEEVASVISFVQSQSSVPVCLDTEGAQIRTGRFPEGQMIMRDNTFMTLSSNQVPGYSDDAGQLSLYPDNIVNELEIGDILSIDFNSVLCRVVGKAQGSVEIRVLNGGVVGQNKGVSLDRPIPMPSLTDKDKKAIAIARQLGVAHFALSFAKHAWDVDELRNQVGNNAFIISKIECLEGIHHLKDIVAKSDAILIDRGDLSREVPIERIPAAQKFIMRKAKTEGTKVYVATNFLESMVRNPAPTRAEVNDIYNSLIDGADGLVLAAETAIGEHPIKCANIVVKIIEEYSNGKSQKEPNFSGPPLSLLPDAHGGELICRLASVDDWIGIDRLPSIVANPETLMDCEQIANGMYSPLRGFMDQEALQSVLRECRLPDGNVWTLPIVLPIDTSVARELSVGKRVVLTSESGQPHSLLDVSDIYMADFDQLAGEWFGTTSVKHPGVARLAELGTYFVGGAVTLLAQSTSESSKYDLTPRQARMVFAHKGWSRVVGFHGRNVPHRAHEHIQLAALHKSRADGLLISPVIGPGRAGDFLGEPILRAYQAAIDSGVYPDGKVVLGSFSTYPRYAGPREAVFTALCRKNMGCSHFIVGRDHTGVGDYYEPNGGQKLFERLGDIGIIPIFFDAVGYDPKSQRFVTEDEVPGAKPISGSQIREALLKGREISDWMLHPIVQKVLRDELNAGRPLFWK